jgi:quercetin dioxygenase-like cupin family protein
MEIKRAGSQPSGKGPAAWFTGTVRIDPLFQATEPARAAGNSVTFEPGARTAWHAHPLGQTLVVTSGCGWAQRWGGPIEEIRPGDVVWFPPDEKHWHGARRARPAPGVGWSWPPMRSGSREQIEARTPTIRAPRPSTISTWSNHRPNNQRKRWTSLGIVAYLIRVEEAMNGRSCAGRLSCAPG